jgi:hypothetical protein
MRDWSARVGDAPGLGEGCKGTGSYPNPPKGRHLASLRTASQDPRTAPWVATASAAYTEQDGTNLHEPAKSGDSSSL